MTHTDLAPVQKLRKGDEFASVQEFVSWVLDGKPIADRNGRIINNSNAVQYSVLRIKHYIAIGGVVFKTIPEKN